VSLIIGDYLGSPDDIQTELGIFPHRIEPVGLRTPDQMPPGYDPLGFARLIGSLYLTMPATGSMMIGSTTVDRSLVKDLPQKPVGHFRYAIKVPRERLDEIVQHLEDHGNIRLIRY